MPRLTTSDYLRNRAIFARDWAVFGGSLCKLLTTQEPWALHDYYAPTLDWSKDKVLEHRRAITRSPSLSTSASG